MPFRSAAKVRSLLLGLSILLPASSSSLAQVAATDPNAFPFYNWAGASGDTSGGLVKPSLFTGAVVVPIHIVVPAGTGGIQPSLSLAYNSRQGRGNAGVGWSLGLSKIIRSTKYGADKTQEWTPSEAVYLYGDQELIRGVGESDPFGCPAIRYHPKSENFQKILFCATEDYWTVLGKTGTRTTLGRHADTRHSKLAQDGVTFEYFLDELTDPHGLSWQAAYSPTTAYSAPRLDRLDYTFHDGSPLGEPRRVEIRWGRGDQGPMGGPSTSTSAMGFRCCKTSALHRSGACSGRAGYANTFSGTTPTRIRGTENSTVRIAAPACCAR